MVKCIDAHGKAAVFSTLDSNSAYWPVEVEERDRDKAAITSHHKLYRFVQILFALNKSPGTFQHATNVILSSLKWRFGLVFLNNIVVFLRSPCDHIINVEQDLSLL